jgi:hypothetical protein
MRLCKALFVAPHGCMIVSRENGNIGFSSVYLFLYSRRSLSPRMNPPPEKFSAVSSSERPDQNYQ